MNHLLKKISALFLFATLILFSFVFLQKTNAISCSAPFPCWTQETAMPTARREMGVASDASGKIYMVGGYKDFNVFLNTVEVYDPATGTWVTKSPAPVERNAMGFAFNPSNGKFYMAGGFNGSGQFPVGLFDDFYEYDPISDTWAQKAFLSSRKFGLGLTAGQNGKMYAIGGIIPNGICIGDVEEYDPSTNTWTQKAPMPTPRCTHSVITAQDGLIYAIGGHLDYRYNNAELATVEVYDPTTDIWTTKSPMSVARSGLVVIVGSNGKIYAIGGNVAPNPGTYPNAIQTDVVEEYNITTDTWTTVNSLPVAVMEAGGALGSDEGLHVFGGWTATSGAVDTHLAGFLSSLNPTPATTTFDSSADTYVRSGQDNRNEGAGEFMRIRADGDNRAFVRFDQNAIQLTIGSGTVLSAKLRLTIVDNGDNWGITGRTVDAHRLITDWVEGNGTENDRGTGPGATWSCAIDSLIQNQSKNCSAETEWEMGQPNNPSVHPWVQTPTDTQTITSDQAGVVEYDVTADVQSFLTGTNNYGWILKKTNEGQNGLVSFGTKESTSIPQLVITYQL